MCRFRDDNRFQVAQLGRMLSDEIRVFEEQVSALRLLNMREAPLDILLLTFGRALHSPKTSSAESTARLASAALAQRSALQSISPKVSSLAIGNGKCYTWYYHRVIISRQQRNSLSA